MQVMKSKKGWIFLFLILLFPFSLFAGEHPVTGLKVTFYPGVDNYGNSTIEVDISWDPWELMLYCDPRYPQGTNALYGYDVRIYNSRNSISCFSSDVSAGSVISTGPTSGHATLHWATFYFAVVVKAYYNFICEASTYSDPAEFEHTFSCDYVDFPNMPPGNCAIKIGTVGEPVNVSNGEMNVTHTDFTLPGRGIDINFTRAYSNRLQVPSLSTIVTPVAVSKSSGEAKNIERARITCFSGISELPPSFNSIRDGVPMGYGWTHNLSQHLDILLNGQIVRYFDDQGTSQSFTQYKTDSSDASYSPSYNWITSTLVKNPDNTYTLSKEGENYKFNDKGRLIGISDSYSNQVTLTYDASGNLTSLIDTLGRQINFYYDSNKRLRSITGPEGVLVSYEYSSLGLLKKATYSDNTSITYEYNDPYDNMNLTKIIDQNWHSYMYTYDNLDRVVKVERDNSNEKITFTNYNYISPNLYLGYIPTEETTVTNSRGINTTYRYITNSGNTFKGNGLPLIHQVIGVGCSSCAEGNHT